MTLTFDPPLDTVACPTCKRVGTLALGSRMVAKEFGTYSIAGMQEKAVVEQIPELACCAADCDFSELAKRA